MHLVRRAWRILGYTLIGLFWLMVLLAAVPALTTSPTREEPPSLRPVPAVAPSTNLDQLERRVQDLEREQRSRSLDPLPLREPRSR